jgi:hypothetical protein
VREKDKVRLRARGTATSGVWACGGGTGGAGQAGREVRPLDVDVMCAYVKEASWVARRRRWARKAWASRRGLPNGAATETEQSKYRRRARASEAASAGTERTPAVAPERGEESCKMY